MWVQSHTVKPKKEFFPFEGFYIEYPDDQRPKPLPLGLVTMVSDDPPLMNWVYIDRVTGRVRYGNRTESRLHRVGDWGWSGDKEADDEDDEPGGVEFDGEERFVAVEPEMDDLDGRWEVYWDEGDTRLRGRDEVGGRMVYGVSLERVFVDDS